MVIASLRARAWATDPGLQRLATALRATVTWAIVVVVLLLATAIVGVSATFSLPGMLVVSAAKLSLTMNLTNRQRQRVDRDTRISS